MLQTFNLRLGKAPHCQRQTVGRLTATLCATCCAEPRSARPARCAPAPRAARPVVVRHTTPANPFRFAALRTTQIV